MNIYTEDEMCIRDRLSELDAAIGQVIVMKVQTGEIKASVGSDSILQESGLVRTLSLIHIYPLKKDTREAKK